MKDEPLDTIRESYDRVAEEYARHIFTELDRKPLDREILTHFAAKVNGKGKVCDMGCGPGHVARYLHKAGADVFGLDLSPGMLEQARRLNPQIPFHEGNLLALDLPDASLAGIIAFYAVVNLPRKALPLAFREMTRVLQPGGLLLFAHHIGEETLHKSEWWDCPVNMDFHLLDPQSVQSDLENTGLVVEEIIEREPYAPEVEAQTRRAYIIAHKP